MTEAWQVFYQRQNGMIETEVAEALLARFAYFARTSLFDGVWHRNLKTGFPAEFRRYVESHLPGADERDIPS